MSCTPYAGPARGAISLLSPKLDLRPFSPELGGNRVHISFGSTIPVCVVTVFPLFSLASSVPAQAIGTPPHVPGDVILDLTVMSNQILRLGDGLRQDCDVISTMKAGKLRFSKPNKYWVESSQKRYVPCAGDSVLGIVVDCRPDNFLVDIKGPMMAFLPVLAFDGGTRRNIPKFEVNASSPRTVILVGNAVMNSETLSGTRQRTMVEKLLEKIQ